MIEYLIYHYIAATAFVVAGYCAFIFIILTRKK